MIWVKIWRRNIFRPKDNFSQRKQHFYTFSPTLTYRARLRLCCRTGSTVLTTEITYIFLHIRFTCTSCVSIKHPKHPKRIRFTYTFCVQLDVLNAVCFLVYAPLAPFNCTFDPLYVYVLLIRLMLWALSPAPLTPYTYTFNLYVLLIRYTYTYYIYFILTYNTYIFYLQLNVDFPSFLSNFLENFFTPQIFPKIFHLYFFPKIFLRQFFPKYLHRADS